MAVRPASSRITKWQLKMKGEALSVVTGRQFDAMDAQVQVMFPQLEAIENATQAILAEAGSQTILNPSYMNFARQVFKAKRRFSGGQLIYAVNIILNRWVAEELDQDTLEKIRDVVLTLPAPAP